MSKFPWKTAIAGAAVLAGTVYVFAAQLAPGNGPMQHGGNMGPMHQQMMQGQGMHQGMQGGMHGGMGQHGAVHGRQFSGARLPSSPGQDAFGAIQEIVQLLEADPSTDWSKVNITALRDHLIDMNEVTLRAVASEQTTANGIIVEVTGEGRTLAAIKRMVPAHVRELKSLGWNAETAELPSGVKLSVMANDAVSLVKLKALGFIGIMAQGGHHQPHHLMMAKGEFAH